jgi:hypothetical protein
MKLLISTVLLLVMTSFAHAQVSEDAGLPSNGESAPPPVMDAPPVENPKEFNQDIDDFENKISKEVPAANGASAKGVAHKTDSAEKARGEMKKAMQADRDGGGNGIAARKAAKAKGTIAKKCGKKASVSKAGKKKSIGKKSAKKPAARKKKKTNS